MIGGGFLQIFRRSVCEYGFIDGFGDRCDRIGGNIDGFVLHFFRMSVCGGSFIDGFGDWCVHGDGNIDGFVRVLGM